MSFKRSVCRIILQREEQIPHWVIDQCKSVHKIEKIIHILGCRFVQTCTCTNGHWLRAMVK